MPSLVRQILTLAGCMFGLLACALRPADGSSQTDKIQQPDPAAVQLFENKVRPLLADNCFKCHAGTKQKGGLRLDSRAALLEGGDRGPAVVAGQPEKSLLIKAVGYNDAELRMPPAKKLAKEHIASLTEWVRLGAQWPGEDKAAPAAPRRGELQITDKDRAHWAFQPVHGVPEPAVKNRAWVKNPIDAFILARLEAKGLQPNSPADRRVLIRRAYFDLTGLPPTPKEVETFAAATSPKAYESLIDRLLESPHYGEKWGRHWLDLVRFAETNSYERDDAKPMAWRFRDYVIRAFKDDKPYDQFVREQLAGDELPIDSSNTSARDDGLIATGYYRLGIWDDEPTDPVQARYDGLDDIVATTGQVFLGLTFDCARCHDHKIDPVPQKDYYRLLAFFHNINHYRNSLRDTRQLVGSPEAALAVTEAGRQAPDTFVLLRGNPHVKGDKVEPDFPQIFAAAKPVFASPDPKSQTCGRRLVLANWIASPTNPLTARVMVNRIWQHHFGRGIVRSASNFGLQGDKPSHPELLDWLASEFIANGWRMKALHRLILTSNAYQMTSRGNAAALAIDPTNDLYWRFDMRRLTAEEIRDSILAVSGTLNLKMFGPSVYVDIPKEVKATQSKPGDGWLTSPPDEQNRRSIYIHIKRSLLTPILESFDMAETDRSTPVRFATTQPTQALGMLNGEFLNKQAAVLANRLWQEAGEEVHNQVRLALALALCRPPTTAEVNRGVELIEALRLKEGAVAKSALKYFCLMVFNLNEFVYLD